jgi:GNAT superfamily N-acetyltransferase
MQRDNDIRFREASPSDMPGISRVRTSVTENLMTRDQLERRGITEASVAASFLVDSRGWVAEHDGQIVGFSIADRKSHSIFALFVLPAFEGQGIGSRLFDLATQWLWANGSDRIWLTTAQGTRAARFYERRGWIANGRGQHGDVRYEQVRPGTA